MACLRATPCRSGRLPTSGRQPTVSASASSDSTHQGPVWVALDLETTGLDPTADAIIEVGAVKFREGQSAETFSTLVNPARPLSTFIQELTGITPRELESAPSFGAVRDGLAAFVGAAPVVGHSVSFDLAFLRQAGLNFPGPAYDTLDLASVLFPSLLSYSLASVAKALNVVQDRPHRALGDAETTKAVFLGLLGEARRLPDPVLDELRAIAGRSDWPLRSLFRDLSPGATRALEPTEPGLEGIDVGALAERLKQESSSSRSVTHAPLELSEVRGLLDKGGPLAKTLGTFERRAEQIEMAESVTRILNDGGRLVVEAGTGIGKSLAYLLPAALFAWRTGKRIVVSTNTIALQEQLIGKDIPDAITTIAAGEDGLAEGFRYALLKGRGNYLCLRRWSSLKRRENLTAMEARVLCKILVWLQHTPTGDRGDINFTQPEATMWGRLSAQGFDQDSGPCPFARRGLCFYNAARRRAEGAHLVVANHALLTLDAANGGLLPEYEHLIVDEAHNLEEVATSQWGSTVDEDAIESFLDQLAGAGQGAAPGLVAPMAQLARSALIPESRRRDLTGMLEEVEEQVNRSRQAVATLFRRLADFTVKHGDGGGDYGATVRMTRSIRAQPAWSEIEIAWEDANLTLTQVLRQVERLHGLASRSSDAELAEKEGYELELSTLHQRGLELQAGLQAVVVAHDDSSVLWISVGARDGAVRLHAAPLEVGPDLNERLFSRKESVVLTSATLSVEDNLEYVKERLQIEASEELILGSPFDYPRLVLVYLPEDIPDPNRPGYHEAAAKLIAEAARAAGGRTMALFTGWGALRAVQSELRERLAPDGITVMAQGADGTPQQLVTRFRESPNTVLLGAGSLWQGVDIAGDALSVLVIARLPFNVPNEPVFAARSQQFDDPFGSYAVPQAVLRFKQGFGRLIRRKTDRGVLVVLDRRVITKGYGKAFLDSIPRCTVKRGPAHALGPEIERWLRQPHLETAA